MYEDGDGVAKSYEKAAEWYLKAAEQGNVDAQERLGRMYSSGYGVAKSHEKSAEWYRKAAEQGSVHAQSILVVMYQTGYGVVSSLEHAAEWCRKAAEHPGHSISSARSMKRGAELLKVMSTLLSGIIKLPNGKRTRVRGSQNYSYY